jgi:hypothetical protein
MARSVSGGMRTPGTYGLHAGLLLQVQRQVQGIGVGAPWGGRKASGMGSVYGPEGLHTYLANKCVFLPAGSCSLPVDVESGPVQREHVLVRLPFGH